jgi:hypothetical protein
LCIPIRSRSGTIFDEATMSSLLRSALPVLAACCLLALPRAGHAQAFGGGEYERALRPGAYVPYDGASFSHRYNYEYGPVLYLNQGPRTLYYLDYLDRVDRAERFGYRMPNPPTWSPGCGWRWAR